MNIAFAGIRHDHVFVLYKSVLQDNRFKIVGAFESDEEGIAMAQKNGLEITYASYNELLSDKSVEAVILGGCFGDRGQMAIDALNSGKHVIADKPLCTSLEELYMIKEAAQLNNKKVSCMFTMRYEPMIVTLKKLIDSKKIGEIIAVTFGGQHPLKYGRRPSWYYTPEKHGGTTNDIAIHAIDIFRYLGMPPISKIEGAREWNFFSEDPALNDCSQFMLTLENGCGILGDVSYAIPDGIEFALPYYWHFTFWGSHGTLSFNINDKSLTYYQKGVKEGITIDLCPPAHNYLDDFLKLVNNENGIILPQNDVFDSTEQTLKIQKHIKSSI